MKSFFLYLRLTKQAIKIFILFTFIFLASISQSSASSNLDYSSAISNANPPSSALKNKTPSHILLSGRAVKGVIVNGEVSVYSIQNGSPSTAPIQTGFTDATGNFELYIPQDKATNNLYIEVKANNDSDTPGFMYCDSYIGCAVRNWLKTEFGETFTLKSRFLLRSFSSYDPVNDIYPIKFTPMEHMAVAYAESLTDGLTQNNFNDALSYISNIFLLSENILSIKAINLLSVAEVSNASDEEVVVAILSSAFLGIDNGLFGFKSIESILKTLTKQSGSLPTTVEEGSNEISLLMISNISLNNIPPYLENRPNIRNHLERIQLFANNQTQKQVILNLETSNGGKIISTSHSFECTGTCQYEIPHGDVIQLEAQPDTNFVFGDWGNTCPDLIDQTINVCEFIINENQQINTIFIESVPITTTDTTTDTSTDTSTDTTTDSTTDSTTEATTGTTTNTSSSAETFVGELVISKNSDRSSPIALESSTLLGLVYIELLSTSQAIKNIQFFLDTTSGSDAPFSTEGIVPYDFNGTATDGTARALDTSTLPNGAHFIYALVTLTDETIIAVRSDFIIQNTFDNTISWSPPTVREDGSVLKESDITKYVIYYGKSSKTYTGAIVVDQRDNNILSTIASINHLEPGMYYFAGVTVDSNGLGSTISNEVPKLVQ